MKITKYVSRVCVGLATLGLVVPSPGLVNGAEKQVASRPATSIVDVSLVAGGVLQGQVVTAQGQPMANAPVVLHQGKNEVAKTSTDGKGEFRLGGLQGGVYVVSTDGAAGIVRAWAPRTAPPSSVHAVLLVPQEGTARAQLGTTDTNWGLGALIIGGVVATILAVTIDHNSAS
jgi:hypothetical protein